MPAVAVEIQTKISLIPPRPRSACAHRELFESHQIAWRRVSAWLLMSCLAMAGTAAAQNSPQTQNQPAAPVPAGTSGAGQAIPPVTTTVVVHGDVKDDYLPETVTAGTLDGAPLSETPLSATVVTRDLLTDQVARLLSDVVKNDASIGEDYAPVGYYGDFRNSRLPDRPGDRPEYQRNDDCG